MTGNHRKRIRLLFLLAVTAAAQTPPEESPTFSAATRLVEVDVVARSKGAPATGLTKEDFTLLDNGKPQKISIFSVRSGQTSGPASGPASGTPSGPAAAPLPPGAVSNRLERGGNAAVNVTVLLIDQVNTPVAVQAYAIPRVVKFLQMHRDLHNGRDRIGVYTFSGDGLRAVQEITDDAELLSRAARSLKARDRRQRSHDTTGMTAHAATDYEALETQEAAVGFRDVLKEVARHLARVPGRKSLIWVTNSFPLFIPPPPAPPFRDFRKEMEDGARALNDANVALYAVDARGLQGALDGMTAIQNAEFKGPQTPAQLRQQMHRGEPISPDGLITERFLADLTGGLVIYNKSNAIEESIQTLVDDGEFTYTLGFYPAQEAQDQSLHDLKVVVRKPGVSVRYRKNYFVSNVANERPSLETLLKDPLDATQLELVAETIPDPARPGSWQVRVAVDLHNVQLERQEDTWVGAVDVSFLVEGSRTARTTTTKVTIPDKRLADALEKGIVVNNSIDFGGKTGVLRIVAQDRAGGLAGSVRVPFGKR
jgi:VWFA-related protein